jgi:RecJ-like exonuclease
MICPECDGKGFIRILGQPDSWETSQNPFANEKEITCPTCEGDGELPDTPAIKRCLACGEPIAADRDWCDEHKDAALVGDRISASAEAEES